MSIKANLTGVETLTAFMASMPGKNQRATNSAMASIGYKLKTSAKQMVKSNAFGWPTVRNLTVITKKFPAIKSKEGRADFVASHEKLASAVYENAFRDMNDFQRSAWSSLASLIVYKFFENQGILQFGFFTGTFGKKKAYANAPLGPDGKPVNGSWGTNQGKTMYVDNNIGSSAINIAKRLTEGFTETLDSSARRRYYAALGFIMPLGKVLVCPPRPVVGPVFNANKSFIPGWFRDKFWERLRKYSGEVGSVINSTWKA